MSILKALNELDENLKKEAEEKRIREAKEAEEAEERKAREEQEKRIRAIEEEKKELKAIIESDDKELDEPHVYTARCWYKGRTHPTYGRGPEPIPAGFVDKEIVMTEREMRVMKILGHFPISVPTEVTGRDILRVTDKKTEEQELSAETTRRKVEIIKSTSEEDRKRRAVCYFRGFTIETDDEHAALCSINVNRSSFRLSDVLEIEAQKKTQLEAEEAQKKAQLEAEEAQKKAQLEAEERLEQQKEKMKKEHPVRYTLGQIKNALKNRRRGRE